MSDTENAPEGDSCTSPMDEVASAVNAERGDSFHIESIELVATRAADTLRRVLSTDEDEEPREQLVRVLQELSTLQFQLGEWQELHHILHAVLAPFASFQTDLRGLAYTNAKPVSRRALLRGWRPCQGQVDRLLDFESRVETIHLFQRYEGAPAYRPDWGARMASLRREIEDRLREEKWSASGLIDLTDEFSQACDCYLGLADRELRQVIEKVQRLYTHLLGGLL